MTTVDELFTLAIAAERAAESLYLGLTQKLPAHADVVILAALRRRRGWARAVVSAAPARVTA
jgi:hypothetical protein